MKKATFILFICLIAASCRSKRGLEKSEPEKVIIEKKVEEKTAKETFDQFYKRFHSDSAFQLSRIKFPLEGEKILYDSTIYWSKENWLVIKTKIRDIDTSEFKVNIIEGKSEVREEVEFKDVTGYHFGTTYRFINGKWYLVSCNDINL